MVKNIFSAASKGLYEDQKPSSGPVQQKPAEAVGNGDWLQQAEDTLNQNEDKFPQLKKRSQRGQQASKCAEFTAKLLRWIPVIGEKLAESIVGQ